MSKTSLIIKICLFLMFFASGSIIVSGSSKYSIKNDDHLQTIKEKSFDTTPGKDFVLSASSGDVIINSSDNPKVYIKILGNKEAADKMDFSFNNSVNGVEVTAKKKDGWNLLSFFKHLRLRFEITLPVTYNAKVSSSGGDIYLNKLEGQIILKTSGGDISIKNTKGQLTTNTSGGDIQIENCNGETQLKTSGGDITADTFTGNMEAITSGGDITLKGANGKIKASTSGGEVNLNYSGNNKGIELYSSGGDISALLPADFNADANFSTSGGTIKCGFKTENIEKLTSSRLEGTFNKGGIPFTIKTSGGDIQIKQK